MHERLSNPPDAMRDRYGIIIIGSGYGGAITGARLAQAGHDVCILERGREWITGTFPDRWEDVVAELKGPSHPLGLYEYIAGMDVDIFSGNGLGGTSLVNANVAIRPGDDVFQHRCWPQPLRDEAASGQLDRYYERAGHMLRITPARAPDGTELAKFAAHARSAEDRPGRLCRLDVAVNFDEFDNQPNHVGVVQQPCLLCGDCVTGCNVGAKNTLDKNYLPLAKQHGAEIYSQIEVDFLLPVNEGGYAVFVRHWTEKDGGCDPVTKILHANAVVVAAGVMGTAGIMLRSRARGLALSKRLGHRFSANGDLIGFGYNNDVRTDTSGFGNHPDPSRDYAVGPTIMSMIDYRDQRSPDHRFLIEEGAFPLATVPLLRGSIHKVAAAHGEDTDTGIRDRAQELARVVRDLVTNDPKGALNHTMIYLGMGHDDGDGRIILGHDGNARLLWGSAPEQAIFKALSKEMGALVTALGGTYIANPRGTELLNDNEVTVHPLGGCPMGDDCESGVVDHIGRAFANDASEPSKVYEGLFIADASIIPTSIGVNPFFTISALAERTAEHIAALYPEPITPKPGDITMPSPNQLRPGIEFTEDMRGYCTDAVTNASTPEEFRRAEALAKQQGQSMNFRLTIVSEDVDDFIHSPQHEAVAEGYVDSVLFGARRRVEEGVFNLFVEAESSKKMLYRLAFLGADDKPYLLDGFKVIRDEPGFDVWSDTTTLFTSIHAGWSKDDPIVAQGILHVRFDDFLRQLTTFRVRHSNSVLDTAAWLTRFGVFFFGELWATYVKPYWEGRHQKSE